MDDVVKDRKKIRIYYSLLITVLCIIAVSYAFFTLFLRQSDNNTLASRTCFSTTFTEDSDKIGLSNEYPVVDSVGMKKQAFSFTIKNNCSSYVKVYITIDSEHRGSTGSSYLDDNYIKYNLSPSGTKTSEYSLVGSKTLMDLDAGSKGYVLNTFYLGANEEKSYDLRLWIDENVTLEQGLGKSWDGKVVVVSEASKEPTFAETILANNEVKAPITTPGATISTSSEALLASTEDDYGTSYYFRGAVTNNYVEFANKCWRIVRIGGDNTVKLILHNDNTSNASNPCSSSNNSTTVAFAHYNGSAYTSAFNPSFDDNTYIGFMYGIAGSTTYEETHANTNKSTILTNLEKWYNNNLKTYESVIDDNVFCNDKSISGSGLGYGTNQTYYGTYGRLYTNKTPSLKCNGDLSKITSKIGLITADELAFAGYVCGVGGHTVIYKKMLQKEFGGPCLLSASVVTVFTFGTFTASTVV